jgi:uncharacterized membrane protein YuzA (DUF378 family)
MISSSIAAPTRDRRLAGLSLAQLASWAPIAAIIVLAAALRIYHIRSQSLWLDELSDGTAAKVPWPDFFPHVRTDAAAAPLDYMAVRAITAVLGHGTAATRTWALLMGIAAVPLIYIVGRRIFESQAVGLAAALLLSLSAFHIFYSQEARFYALAVVVELLNLLAFVRALSKPRPINWLAYGATCALALYSHYFVAFLFPLEGLFVAGLALRSVLGRTDGRGATEGLKMVAGCAAAQALAVLLFTPWILFALTRQLDAGYPRIPDLTLDRAKHIFTVLIGLASPWAPATADETRMTGYVVVLALIGLAASMLRRRFLPLLLAAGAVAAVPLAWRADQVAHYFWIERQVIIVLPLVFLLAAAGYVECLRLLVHVLGHAEARGWLRLVRTEVHGNQISAAVAGLGVGVALAWSIVAWPGIARVYGNGWIPKENWWGATAFVSNNICPTTTLYSQLGAQYSYGIAYYNARLEPRTRFGGLDAAAIEALVVHSRLTPDDWIILLGQGGGYQSSLDGLLTSRGWRRAQFDGVTVYHGAVCTSVS